MRSRRLIKTTRMERNFEKNTYADKKFINIPLWEPKLKKNY